MTRSILDVLMDLVALAPALLIAFGAGWFVVNHYLDDH